MLFLCPEGQREKAWKQKESVVKWKILEGCPKKKQNAIFCIFYFLGLFKHDASGSRSETPGKF